MEEGQSLIRVNGREYAFPPTDLTLGEMCDAEQYFGVDFAAGSSSGMRMTAALLWITIKRTDATVTVDDVRSLDPNVFAELEGGDANPPQESSSAQPPPEPSESSGPPSNGSPEPSAGSALAPSLSGRPGSDTTSDFDRATSAP
jgi:hypothetical protein